MGQTLMDRALPEAVSRLQEMGARMSADGPTGDDATEQLALLWPGYFADPAAAPPWPARMRVSAAVNVATVGSIFELLASGFAESVASIAAPAIFVLGERAPSPTSRENRRPR